MSLEITAIQSIYGREIVNVFEFITDQPGTDGAVSIATAIRDAFDTYLRPIASTDWQLTGFTARPIPAVPGEPALAVAVPNLPVNGTVTGSRLPATVALHINEYSNLGPPYRGGIFLATINSSRLANNGQWVDSTIQAGVDFLSAISIIQITPSATAFLAIRSGGTATVPKDTLAAATSFLGTREPSLLKSRKD